MRITLTFLTVVAVIAAIACTSDAPAPTLPTAAPITAAAAVPDQPATPAPTATNPPSALATATPFPTPTEIPPSPTPITPTPEPTVAEPEPTVELPPQPPTATPPPASTDFIAMLSDAEVACLPTQPANDVQFFQILEDTENIFSNAYTDCLTPQNQFEVYLHTVRNDPTATDELSLDTHRCVWNGIMPLFTFDDEDATEEQLQNVLAMIFFMPMAIAAYCVADDELIAAGGDPDDMETRFLRCMVESQGGPREFANRLIYPSGNEDVLEQAEEECRSLAMPPSAPATPMPPPTPENPTPPATSAPPMPPTPPATSTPSP